MLFGLMKSQVEARFLVGACSKKTILLSLLMIANMSIAHEAPKVSSDKLVPIPAYTHMPVPASGHAATQAAKTLIRSLSDKQRESLLLAYDDKKKKTGWSNLPAKFVSRPGLRLGELNSNQQKLLFQFLSASLSLEGYERVGDIMAGEAYLSDDPEAKRYQWAPENYWLAIFGQISDKTPWAWQFGGHHLGLNVSVKNNVVNSISPSFVGTEPAVFIYDGVKYENIRDMHLAGFAIYETLNKQQKLMATLHSVPADVVTGPGKDNVSIPQVGVLGSELNKKQRKLLLAAIKLWVEMQPEENAVQRMREIASDFDKTSFAWVGSSKNNEPAYFRIHGPSVVIELLSNGLNVGKTAKGKGHYHTIYRNPKLEYGKSRREFD